MRLMIAPTMSATLMATHVINAHALIDIGYFFSSMTASAALDNVEGSTLPTIVLTPKGSGCISTCVHSRLSSAEEADNLSLWQHCFDTFLPFNVVAKTLSCITQLVPSLLTETSEIMREPLKTHTPELKQR